MLRVERAPDSLISMDETGAVLKLQDPRCHSEDTLLTSQDGTRMI